MTASTCKLFWPAFTTPYLSLRRHVQIDELESYLGVKRAAASQVNLKMPVPQLACASSYLTGLAV